jgi:hypothetical protein
MEPHVYKKIFRARFRGGLVNLNGIILKLIDIVEDDNQTPPYTLNFEMVNPMNLSYTRPALIANLEDEVESLNDVLQTPYYSVVNIINSQKIYLGDDLADEYRRIFQGIKQLKTDVYENEEDQSVYTIINVEHKGISVRLDEGDYSVAVDLVNKVKFLDAYEVDSKTNELVNPLTFDDADSVYSYYINDVVEDPNYNEIFQDNSPIFVYPGFMYLQVFTTFEN